MNLSCLTSLFEFLEGIDEGHPEDIVTIAILRRMTKSRFVALTLTLKWGHLHYLEAFFLPKLHSCVAYILNYGRCDFM